MLVRKEVIRPGIYFYIDPNSGMPRKLTVTPEGARYFYKQGMAMLDAKLSIPVPFEHQPDAVPQTPAQRAANRLLNNSGFVHTFEMDPGDVLMSVLDIQDPEVAKKLPHTIKWTSPWINSFVDGDGRAWNGVISHIALTTTPRITRQAPFPTVSAAMSFAGAIPAGAVIGENPGKDLSLCLSRAGLLFSEGAALRPVFPVAFSLYTGAALALEDMVAEGKKKPKEAKEPAEPAGGDGKGGVLAPDQTDPMMTDPMMKPEAALVDGDGDISVYTVLADLLHTVGIELEEGTTAENFCERLYKAAMEKVKGMGGETPGAAMTTPAATPPAKPASPVVQEQTPMYMSIEQINALPDPVTRRMALELNALRSNTINAAAQKRMDRIERLAPRLRDDVKQKLLAMVAEPSAAFSLGGDGKVADPLDAWLSMLEVTAVDVPELLRTGGASLAVAEQPHPADYTGEMSKERAEALADQLARSSGIPPARKAS